MRPSEIKAGLAAQGAPTPQSAEAQAQLAAQDRELRVVVTRDGRRWRWRLLDYSGGQLGMGHAMTWRAARNQGREAKREYRQNVLDWQIHLVIKPRPAPQTFFGSRWARRRGTSAP